MGASISLVVLGAALMVGAVMLGTYLYGFVVGVGGAKPESHAP